MCGDTERSHILVLVDGTGVDLASQGWKITV